MKKMLIGLLIGLMMFSLACSSPSTNTDDAVATIDGESISRAEFNRNLALIKYNITMRQGPNFFDGAGDEVLDPLREQLLEDMIDEHLILREAKKADIGPTEEYMYDYYSRYMEATFGTADAPSEAGKAIREFLDENDIDDDFLFRMLLNDQTNREYIASIQRSIEDDEDKYDQLLKNSIAQVRGAHILVPLDQKDLADELYQTLKDDPTQFGELAKQNSIDGSAQDGGDLGYFVRTEMVPEFNDASFDAEVGVVTEPVESQYGYHLILISEQRTLDEMDAAGVDEATIELATRGIMEDSIRREYYRRIDEWKNAAEIEKFDLK